MLSPSPFLAEVSDKIVEVSTFWTIGAIAAGVAAVARHHWWARGAVTVAAFLWVGLNVLDVMTLDGDPMGQAILSEMGWSYSAHQFAAALLPLAVVLVPVRGGGRRDPRRGFEVMMTSGNRVQARGEDSAR